MGCDLVQSDLDWLRQHFLTFCDLLSSIEPALFVKFINENLGPECITTKTEELLKHPWIILSLDSTVRHYEVVYLIHEMHAEEVGSVNEKVQGDPFYLSF